VSVEVLNDALDARAPAEAAALAADATRRVLREAGIAPQSGAR